MEIASADVPESPTGLGEPAVRLALVDALNGEKDARACTEAALGWLAEHAACARSMLLLVDPDEDRLCGLCGLGIDHDRVSEMVVDLSQTTHPLAVALESEEAVRFEAPDAERHQPLPDTPLGTVPFLAFPLCPEAATRHGAIGLLLLETRERRDDPKEILEWAGSILANRIAALAYFRTRKARQTRAERPGQDTAVVTALHDQNEAVEKARLYEQVKRHSEELEERVRDATRELADQNELLRRQALQLEHASAMKSQFLSNVSHELRTPLHAIVGYTSVMLEGVAGDFTPPQRERLERVDSNAHHLLAIINDLLDLTRVESGKMPVRVEELRLEDLFDEVEAEAESLILASNLQVGFDVDDGVPPMASDRQKIKQILLNLLSNALEFTPEGRVDVRGRWDGESDVMRIAVSDTGVGISEKHQRTIFEAFGQTGTFYTAGQTGTGLGLSICRRLATVLGGDMELESEEGEGATFTLVLPRTAEET